MDKKRTGLTSSLQLINPVFYYKSGNCPEMQKILAKCVKGGGSIVLNSMFVNRFLVSFVERIDIQQRGARDLFDCHYFMD